MITIIQDIEKVKKRDFTKIALLKVLAIVGKARILSSMMTLIQKLGTRLLSRKDRQLSFQSIKVEVPLPNTSIAGELILIFPKKEKEEETAYKTRKKT